MSILKQLYDGKLYPCQEIIPENCPECRTISREMSDAREHFMRELSAEQVKQFEDIDEKKTQLSNMQAYAYYEYGFKLGIKLMSEAFSNNQAT